MISEKIMNRHDACIILTAYIRCRKNIPPYDVGCCLPFTEKELDDALTVAIYFLNKTED